jgi:hypothetical protein
MVSSIPVNLLDEQLRLYTGQAAAVPQDDPVAIDTVLALALAIYQQIHRAEQMAGEQMSARRLPLDLKVTRHLAALYGRWYEPSKRLFRIVRASKDVGYRIENSNAFIEAYHHARLPALHIEDLIDLELRADA